MAGLAARLDGDGLVIASTPHPAFTLHKRATDEGHLQILDEAVEIADVVGEAGSARLQLLRYEADDVFAGSPEYQLMVFTRRRAAQRYCEAGTGRASPTRRGRRCGGARVLRTPCGCRGRAIARAPGGSSPARTPTAES